MLCWMGSAVSCDTGTGWLMGRKSFAWECGVGIVSEMIRWRDEGGCQDQQLTSFNIHSFSILKSFQIFYEICIDVCSLFFSKWNFIFLKFSACFYIMCLYMIPKLIEIHLCYILLSDDRSLSDWLFKMIQAQMQYSHTVLLSHCWITVPFWTATWSLEVHVLHLWTIHAGSCFW